MLKNVVPNFFDKKVCAPLWELTTSSEAKIRIKKYIAY